MAEIKDWQRQNMKKGASPSAPHEMNAKLHGGANSMHSKIAKPTHPMGGMCTHGYADGGMVYMADGGDVAEARDKEAGLKASANEKVGFFERLKMGNIDDPKSEAYNRFGAGRAKADRDEQSRKDEYAALNAAASKKPEPSANLDLPSDDARAGMDFSNPMGDGNFNEPGSGSVEAAKPAKSEARPVKPARTGGGRMTMPRDMDERRTDRQGGGRTTMANDPRIVKPDSPAPTKAAEKPKSIYDLDRDPLVAKAKDFFGNADKRYLQSKMDRGETLTAVEKAQAKRAGLM